MLLLKFLVILCILQLGCSSNCSAQSSPQNYAFCNNCRLQNNLTVCTTCATNYLINTDFPFCLPNCATPNCLSCANSSICTMCTAKYSLSGSNTCISKCLSNKYYDLTLSSCVLCSNLTSNCLACTNFFDVFACIACQNGYYLNPTNQCIGCSMLSVDCLTCSASNTCLSCNNSKMVAANGSSCVPPTVCNVNFCEFCNDTLNSTCSICSAGYILQANGTCSIFCSPFDGKSYNLSSKTCQCIPGYFLIGNSCQACSNLSFCVTCSSISNCLSCFNGYFLSNGNCTICNANCITCKSFLSCSLCSDGYAVV